MKDGFNNCILSLTPHNLFCCLHLELFLTDLPVVNRKIKYSTVQRSSPMMTLLPKQHEMHHSHIDDGGRQ